MNTCNHCGDNFKARSDAKFCKKSECQVARRRGHKPRRRVNHPQKPCEKCGSMFKPFKVTSRFCKTQECVASRNRVKDSRHRIKRRADFDPTDSYLLKRYGITNAERMKMLEDAGRKCQICGREDALVIDHCHSSGRLRGILCRVCNLAIGNLGDTAESVRRAYDYLAASELG